MFTHPFIPPFIHLSLNSPIYFSIPPTSNKSLYPSTFHQLNYSSIITHLLFTRHHHTQKHTDMDVRRQGGVYSMLQSGSHLQRGSPLQNGLYVIVCVIIAFIIIIIMSHHYQSSTKLIVFISLANHLTSAYC